MGTIYEHLIARVPTHKAPSGATHAIASTAVFGAVLWRRLDVVGEDCELRTLYPIGVPGTEEFMWVPHRGRCVDNSYFATGCGASRIEYDRKLRNRYGREGSRVVNKWPLPRTTLDFSILDCLIYGIGLPGSPFEGEVGSRFIKLMEHVGGLKQFEVQLPEVPYTTITGWDDVRTRYSKDFNQQPT